MVVPSADNHVLATRLLPRHRKAWIGALAFTAVVLGIGAPVLARPTHTAVHTAVHTAAHTAAADKTATSKLPIGKAVVLGLVEGVTEFLPVSSTGHLLVAERLMDVGTKNDADKKATDAYTVIIQLGAILAVLLVSWKRVLEVLQGLNEGDQNLHGMEAHAKDEAQVTLTDKRAVLLRKSMNDVWRAALVELEA